MAAVAAFTLLVLAKGQHVDEFPTDRSDVRIYGAKLDGKTDDSGALRRAFAAVGGAGRISIPAGGVVRLAETVTFDLAGKRGFTLQAESPIIADPDIGNALEVVNGFPRLIDVTFVNGGGAANYAQADPVGAQQGLLLRGVRGGEVRVKGYGYKGRVLRVSKERKNEPKTSMLYFSNIETGDIKARCGQAWYMDASSAFGTIERAWTFWDNYGPIFNGINDLTIGHLEGCWQHGTNGLRFEGCAAVHISKLALGDETYTVDLLTITTNHSNRRWHNITIDEAFLLKGRRGAVVESSDEEGYLKASFYSKQSADVGVSLRDVRKFVVEVVSFNDATGLVIDGSDTKFGNATLMITAAKHRGAVIRRGADVLLRGVVQLLPQAAGGEQEAAGEGMLLINQLRRSEACGPDALLQR